VSSAGELERCVLELGFVACNLNPDPSDGYWTVPPITDPVFYPLYEKMVELDVPAMIHCASSCNPAVHSTCAHYLAGDTIAFMQLMESDLFERFPTLKFVVPHGGGAVPYHWGRYRGLLQDLRQQELEEFVSGNVFFDTCVYWGKGLELLLEAVPLGNILYASELLGAIKGVDPRTGHRYDDTKFLLDAIPHLSEEDRQTIFGGNAMKVYGRLGAALESRGIKV
jgi:4-oxalmesaconate hydratase